MNDDHLNFVWKNKECDVHSYLHKYPLRIKMVTKVVDPTSTTSYCGRLSGYDSCIYSFANLEVRKNIGHISDNGKEE
jgi:hypothetical protein